MGGSSTPGTAPLSGEPEPLSKTCKSNHCPSHSQDHKHEPDGTARELLVTNEDAIEESGSYFRIGTACCEKLLKQEMNTLIGKYCGDDCAWDDVTGAPLKVKLVKEARAIEITFSDNM